MAATHESESDRAHVRSSDLLILCADLTDLRSMNRLWKSNVLILTLFTMLLGYNKKQVSSFNRFFGFEFRFWKKSSLTSLLSIYQLCLKQILIFVYKSLNCLLPRHVFNLLAWKLLHLQKFKKWNRVSSLKIRFQVFKIVTSFDFWSSIYITNAE